MKSLACWLLLVILPVGIAWGAPDTAKGTPAKAAPAAASMAYQDSLKDLAWNTGLGQALTHRGGSSDELALVQKLADRGLETARAWIAKDPQSAEAHYLLGSWLLYGYRVVQTDHLSIDAAGIEHHSKVESVAQSLSESSQEGLDALRTAQELAPKNPQYVMDYAAALLDWEQSAEAMAAVKKVWAENLNLTPAQQARAALLMSDIHVARGELIEARTWIYRALSAQAQNAPILDRLKKLDALTAQAAKEASKQAPAAEEPGLSEPPSAPVATPKSEPAPPAPPAATGGSDSPTPASGSEN